MKTFLFFTTVLAVVISLSSPLWACHYTFDSKIHQVNIGKVVEVKVTVIYEHRRCVIELEDTRFNLNNFELVKQNKWTQEKRGTYSTVLKLKAIKSGTAKLEVVRECSKKGISAAEWKVTVSDSEIAINKVIKKSVE